MDKTAKAKSTVKEFININCTAKKSSNMILFQNGRILNVKNSDRKRRMKHSGIMHQASYSKAAPRYFHCDSYAGICPSRS